MSFTVQGPLLLAGAGKMGGAILSGLLARGLDAALVIVQDPDPPKPVADFLADNGIDVLPFIDELTQPPGVILIAVKPQVMDEVLPPLAKLAGPETLVLSIAAGRRIAMFEKHLPGAAIVRAMPNTPAAIGRGVTVAVANNNVTPVQRALADDLLSAVGDVLWVEDEALLDPVTAVSGSGPAYVFLLAECLAEAGRAAGLDAKSRRAASAGDDHRLGGAARSVGPLRRAAAQERDVARRHDGGGAGNSRRRGWIAEADDRGSGGGNETRPRSGEMSGSALANPRPRLLRCLSGR